MNTTRFGKEYRNQTKKGLKAKVQLNWAKLAATFLSRMLAK
jgi:hypothetical protein